MRKLVVALAFVFAAGCRHEATAPCMRTDTAWSQDCALRFIITSPCQGKITVDNTRERCP